MRLPKPIPVPDERAPGRPEQRFNRRAWLLGMACFCLAGGWAAGADIGPAVGEYQVKATFIYNFTKFTDWPSSAFPFSNAPIVIGIVGEDPFGQTMDDVVRGETLGGRPFVVKRLRADEDLRSCHLLFISRSEKERLPALLNQLKGSSVLTVSEINGFAERGGMVNLALANKSVKVEINQSAAEQAGLQISAKLLKLARLVKS
jgi:hypothetical protein